MDGTVAAYRLPYLLAGDSVVLKHDSIYYEHFYKQLQPWVHYIPFKADLSDLVEKIQWARDHDEEVHHPHSHTNTSFEHKIMWIKNFGSTEFFDLVLPYWDY